jgi:outer membrane murein-binding lipoprotein Lpp
LNYKNGSTKSILIPSKNLTLKLYKMKKTLFTLAITTFMAGTILTGCQNSSKKEEVALDNLEDARENLDEAKEELSDIRKVATEEEWNAFKASTNATIAENEMRIAEMKASMKKTGKSIDDEYAQKIDILEQKNNDIKAKIETYKNDASSDWESFKQEYNRDMDELGQALKNLTVDNK